MTKQYCIWLAPAISPITLKLCWRWVRTHCIVRKVRNTRTYTFIPLSGADPNVADVKGNTPLHVAVAENHARCVGALIDNQTSQQQLLLDMANDEGMTALHLSIRNGHIINVKRLINAGASTKVAESKQGNSALHFAVQESSIELVKYLLSSTNVDANQTNNSDQTPLQLALCAEPVVEKIVEMLLEITTSDVCYSPISALIS